MKRPVRITLRWGVGFGVVLVLLWVSALDGVDDRPYFLQPYYQETIGRLPKPAETPLVLQGPLQAGFGVVKLTPSLGQTANDPEKGHFETLPLAGYGSRRGQPATGVHDDLHVKAVALRVGERTVVLASADALIIPPEVARVAGDRLERETGLPRAHLYLSATHTHCGFGGWGEGMVGEAFAGEFQTGAVQWFTECIVAAVGGALADLQPAALGHGSFMAPQWVRNRLKAPGARVDPEFHLTMVRQDGGRVAVLAAYAAHATVLPSEVMEFSGDYPGYWQRAVEEATGGVAMFFSGSVGSHAPQAGAPRFEGAERMGRALATETVKALAEVASTSQVPFGMVTLKVEMPPLNARVTDDLRLRPWLARWLARPGTNQYLQALRLGDQLWMSTPCDFSGELAVELKDSLRARGADLVITSFNGGYVGYVIPGRYYHMAGYESRVMSWYGPHVPDYFMELMRALGESLFP